MEPQKTKKLISHKIVYRETLLLLSTLMMINPSFCTAVRLGNETDQLALLEFKSLIAEDPYNFLSSWNKTLPHCQWPGVTCGHKHQRVTALNLPALNLLGSISPRIGNLSFLKYIDLGTNRLYGEIPQEIGQLYRLRQLEMINNTLGGLIPSILSNCTELDYLDLGGNNFRDKIPSGLGSLKKLVGLGMGHNNLSGEIPQSFGNLSSLRLVSLALNNLHGIIPNELTKLRNLTFFAVDQNNFSGVIPISLYNISSLTFFSVTVCNLSGTLPSDVGSKLPKLNWFRVDGNLLTGTIPTSIANMSQLQSFGISDNSFTGQVPNNLGSLSVLQYFNVELNKLGGDGDRDLDFLVPLSNCSKLEALSFALNNLSGQLPRSIADMINLNTLYMDTNDIYGAIPEALGSLTNLYRLAMGYNHFSGTIPSSLGKLKTLQVLYLDGNQLTGLIPSTLGNISQLDKLFLSNNRLIGSIPNSLGNFKNLQILDLSSNNLTGAIPAQVIAISLQYLNLSQNSLAGPLPTQLGKGSSIYAFDVSSNYLSGEIPTSIGDCLSLESLNLQRNSFQGTIPSSMASLKGIQYLDLSRNNFSGEIPPELGNLTYIQYLNLSFNDLEGEIPTRGVFINASAISVFGNRKLCGGMPELGQPLCPTHTNKKHNTSYIFKLVIPLVCLGLFITVLSSFGALYWRRKKKKDSAPASLREDKLMRVSYWEIYRATNGFSLENLIGSGSFGSVYKGKLNQQASTLIAVKVLNLQNSRASKSFLAECKILRNIRHRNLLKIITYCSSIDPKRNEFKALVYEFMPKGNLDMWLHPDEANSSRTLNLLQRVNIAIDVACALQHLHGYCEAPIVHCDLKPSNILLNDDMCACVGDFGLARFHPKISGEISEMSSIGLRGSIGYAAPEYGTGSEVSTSGDIYSYGIILLEMMTARRPTDDIFKDGLDLHTYVEKALKGHLDHIIDPVIYGQEKVAIVEEDELGEKIDEIVMMEEQRRNIRSSSHGENLKTYIMSILTIGLACSQVSPTQRMDLNDVNKELHHVKNALLGRGKNAR